MQNNLLAKNPSAPLQVYSVWVPMLWSDAREMWNGTTIPDARVIHFWDGDLQVGEWFAEHVEGYRGVAWDVYYLYGPGAKWETVPAPLVASGGTIYGERETLETQINLVLQK